MHFASKMEKLRHHAEAKFINLECECIEVQSSQKVNNLVIVAQESQSIESSYCTEFKCPEVAVVLLYMSINNNRTRCSFFNKIRSTK